MDYTCTSHIIGFRARKGSLRIRGWRLNIPDGFYAVQHFKLLFYVENKNREVTSFSFCVHKEEGQALPSGRYLNTSL